MEDLPTIEYGKLYAVYADMSLARPGSIVVMCMNGRDPCGIGSTVEEARKDAMRILIARGGHKRDSFTVDGEARRVVMTDRQIQKARTEWRIRTMPEGFMVRHLPSDRSKVFPTREHAQAAVAAHVSCPGLSL